LGLVGRVWTADSGHVIRRPLSVLLTALVALILAAPASAATCSGETSQPFLRYLDPFWYRLAGGGSLDGAARGWTLSGAARGVVSDLAPDLADSGQPWVLGVPAGATATSPVTCLALDSPTLRFMVRSTGSPLGILVVTAVLRDHDGLLARLPVGVVTGLANNTWKPSLPMLLAVPEVLGLGDTVDVQWRFTVTGLGGAFQVDDLYVDPYRKN
jgi:hypothetical protein